ncbi:MAG: hypothetical protein QY323_00490 [Patescibacteria group bacterium]|nr:MAG: hypothetical protein QY323_00490 [Patescibacteria group bacterium]
MELRFLYPENIGEDRTAWRPHGQPLSFGGVTRLEKIVHKRFAHLSWSAHQRAGICVVSTLLGKLFETLDNAPSETVAPHILVYEYQDELDAELARTQGDVIDPDFSIGLEGTFARVGPKHNALRALEDEAAKEHLKTFHPALKPPLLWEQCGTLARWLQEAESAETDEWRQLRTEPVSLAVARVWHAWLHELGKVGARALFVFDP